MVEKGRIQRDYRELIAHTGIPAFTTTKSGRFLEVNDAFLEVLEFTWDILKDTPAEELFKDKSDRQQMLDSLEREGYVLDTMIVLETKSGKTKYFLESAIQKEDPEHELIFNGFLIDITDQIEAEDRLRILDKGIEKAPMSFIIWNINDEIEYVNPRFTELSGYTPNDILGKSPRILNDDFLSEEEKDKIYDDIRHNNIWTGQMRNRRPNGSRYTVDLTIVPVTNRFNQVTHFLAIHKDITEDLKKDQLVKESERKFRLLFDNARVGIVLANDIDNIIDANDYFLNMIGYELFELLGEGYQLFTHPDDYDLTRAILKEAREQGYTKSYDKRYITKDQDVIWGTISISTTNFFGQDHYIISVSNITQRKLAEEREQALRHNLVQATKFEAIGRLSGNIAHDFNNLLTIIMNNTELIKLANRDDELRSYLLDIERSANYGANIVSNLLKFSRKSPVSMEVVSINQILSHVFTMLESGLGPKIKLTLSIAEDAHVLGNESELSSAIMNIGLNGIEALNKGGVLIINSYIEDNQVLITIQDNGSGIAKEDQDKIFEPFYSTKDDGTGLGLSSALGIITEHHGSLSVHSELDVGTTFTISLPVHISEDDQAKEEEYSQKQDTESIHLMIIDDEEAILTTSGQYFMQKGYEISTFKSSILAERFYQENWEHVDLIILDLNLGDHSGLETLDILKSINPSVKVILYSGYLNIPTILENSTSVLKILTKPMNLQSLEREIQDLIKQHRSSIKR